MESCSKFMWPEIGALISSGGNVAKKKYFTILEIEEFSYEDAFLSKIPDRLHAILGTEELASSRWLKLKLLAVEQGNIITTAAMPMSRLWIYFDKV